MTWRVQRDRETDRQTDRQTDRETDRETDGETDGQMDGETDGQMESPDRQAAGETRSHMVTDLEVSPRVLPSTFPLPVQLTVLFNSTYSETERRQFLLSTPHSSNRSPSCPHVRCGRNNLGCCSTGGIPS